MTTISRATARVLDVPVKLEIAGTQKTSQMSICHVEVETADGRKGHGISAITQAELVADAVNKVAAGVVEGADPIDVERIWERLYWTLVPRGQSGIGTHAIAALDVAIWDLRGQILGQPVWRLLGGARERVPVYVTFGFDFFSRDELASAAKEWVARGFRHLKMTVGHQALAIRDRVRPVAETIREDVERVRAVREAVGPEVRLYLDANCSLDHYHALKLAQALADYDIAFFEEPITQNDVRQMADLRRQGGIQLACGQNEGQAWRFRDLLVAEAADVLQPNVVITGGFTQCARIAAMASAFNVPVANGGGWIDYNMHLQAGVPNGTLCEYHHLAVEAYRQLSTHPLQPKDGWIDMPERPGLGFAVSQDALRDFARKA